jgi:hypothetical protein
MSAHKDSLRAQHPDLTPPSQDGPHRRDTDRTRLAAIIGDRSRPLKHVQRARIVLHSADRLPALEVARRSQVSRPAVWRWQRH